MIYEYDPMLAEIRHIRKALWDESGHDLHAMIQLINQEARDLMNQYGKICQERDENGNGRRDKNTRTMSPHSA